MQKLIGDRLSNSDLWIMSNLIFKIMKKSIEIAAHLFLWILFTLLVLVYSKHFFQLNPDVPAAGHLPYIVFIELVMGLIFFYATFFGIPPARKKTSNMAILVIILFLLLAVFAYPATRHGSLEVLSSVLPHISLVFLAVVFRNLSDSLALKG